MKKLAVLAGIALLSATSLSFATSLQSLNKSQVTREVQGKTITTIPVVTINDQLVENTFTGFFDKNGDLKGQLANKPDSDPQTDTGKWQVKSDGTLCATWQHWNQGKAICTSVFRLKNGLLFINQKNRKIETVVIDDSIKTGDQIS